MRWLIIGDSLTEGMMPFLRDGLQAKGIPGSIIARSGWSAQRWYNRGSVASRIVEKAPDLVVYILGTNDDDPPDERSIKGLLQAARGAEVRWVGPFDSNSKDPAFQSILGSRYIPGVPLAQGLTRTRDGVHFPTESYKVLAKRVIDAVESSRGIGIPNWAVIAMIVAAGFVVIGLFASPKIAMVWESRPPKRREG